MNIQQAREELKHIGLDYFYDELDRFTINEILNQIRGYISRTSKLEGLSYWEITRDAFFLAIGDLSNEELDGIIEHEYGLSSERLGGSKEFLLSLATIMDEEICKVKQILSD